MLCDRITFIKEKFKIENTEQEIEIIEIPEKSNAVSFEQQKIILKKLKDARYRDFFWFCCCTGMRVCEAFSIKGSDIYIDKNYIHIRLPDTKTKKHRRDVPCLPELFKDIKIKKTKLLFEGITNEGSKQYFTRFYRELGFDLSRHSTRHTFISICNHIGISPEQIQKWVGHTDVAMTRDTYTHVLDKGNSPILAYIKKLKKVLKAK